MPFDPVTDKARIDALPKQIQLANPVNHQDMDALVDSVGRLAASKMDSQSGRRNDAQIAATAAHMATVTLEGFYGKRPLKTYWADGRYITISDSLPPGADEILYSTAGARYNEVDDGIYADDVSPEREVTDALKHTRQRFHTIKHKFTITQQDVWRAALTGYDKFAQLGAKMREAHLNALNGLIRRGSSKYKLHGITNHPNVRRRVASANWYTGLGADIHDDVVSCITDMYDSETEEDVPTRLILPRPAMIRFNTALRSAPTSDRTVRQALEMEFDADGFMIMPDPGMKSASTLGGPAAILYTDEPNLVSVSCPLFMYLTQPREIEAGVIEVQIWTRFAGVQVRDTDSIMVVEGPTWA